LFRFKNDCLVTIRNLVLSKSTLDLSFIRRLQCQNILSRSTQICNLCSGNANAAVRRYANAYITANRGYFELSLRHPAARQFCRSTIAAKILWSSLFDTSNVNQVLMSIYMTISNYSCQKYGTFSF
jgi:hypothetical protein